MITIGIGLDDCAIEHGVDPAKKYGSYTAPALAFVTIKDRFGGEAGIRSCDPESLRRLAAALVEAADELETEQRKPAPEAPSAGGES